MFQLIDRAMRCFLFILILSLPYVHASNTGQLTGCLSCHEGIADFSEGPMTLAITAMSKTFDKQGCTVCHGGDPTAKDKEKAHAGSPELLVELGGAQHFYPDPGSIWIADKTCGLCHAGYVDRVKKSLMGTEAGKLQGNLWSWGIVNDHNSNLGNYDIKDEDGPVPNIGTPAYKKYMTRLAEQHPDQFPIELSQVQDVNVDDIPDHPNLAGITYSRQQCQRCHVGVSGSQRRGDFRGTGCSSCHVPYGVEGLYEGEDPTIDKTVPGKLLVHKMQATRKSKITHNGLTWSGIPSETCRSCHNRGKRVGPSFNGIMEFPYGSPYTPTGGKQESLHGKYYTEIEADVHHQIPSREGNPSGGLLCQDCHTSIDMHGDGNIPGTTLAQVEIECSDCHGTPSQFPWELPLGYGEEFGGKLDDKARGLAHKLPKFMKVATVYEKRDGYLLSARGNPLGNVVKDGDKVVVHSATGLDFNVPVLKQIADTDTWKDPSAKVAKMAIDKHMEGMECYACHANWAPQCYGCHITVDYSEGKQDADWIANVNSVGKDGLTPDAVLGSKGLKSAGKVSETRSYLRWETPILGINGEGRVTPLMPGCQVITTVIDKDGNTVVHNKLWGTPEGNGLDHSPVQPHTIGRKSRDCESCHSDPKTLGYGISDGEYMSNINKLYYADLKDAQGKVIPKEAKVQIQPIPELEHDLSKIVDREEGQIVSVGSHWPLAGPLPKEMRDKMERSGTCLGCHSKQQDEEFWNKVSQPGFLNNEQHQKAVQEAIEAKAK